MINTATGSPRSTGSPAEERLRSKVRAFAGFARDLGRLSTCKRLQIGCVVTSLDLREVFAIGYNGPPVGTDNGACREGTPGGCGCVHAEANALIKLKGGQTDLVVITTKSPCEHCAGLIVNSHRVAAVVWEEMYREPVGLDVLRRAGVTVVRLEDLLEGVGPDGDGDGGNGRPMDVWPGIAR